MGILAEHPATSVTSSGVMGTQPGSGGWCPHERERLGEPLRRERCGRPSGRLQTRLGSVLEAVDLRPCGVNERAQLFPDGEGAGSQRFGVCALLDLRGVVLCD
jgi:hypothetical protein